MAYPHGTRALGERHVFTALAGGTIAKGDLLQSTEATGSLTVNAAATNVSVNGFALAAIASAATGDVDQIRPGDQFWVKVSTGTVSATTLGKFADIVNSLSVTLTNVSNDCRVVGWDGVTNNFCIVEFINSEVSTKL